MDYRRSFGLRPPCPIGDSTFLVPQCENYSLFAIPFLDLNKRIGNVIEGMQQDVKSQSEEDSTEKITTRRAAKKKEEDVQKVPRVPQETKIACDSFGIVLNMIALKPEEVAISFGKGNEIMVQIEQKDIELEFVKIPFSRKCTYKYELPNGVDKNSLVALWTSDDYLIILPKVNLRKELLDQSIKIPKGPEEPSDKEVTSSVKMECKDKDEKPESKPGTSKGEGKKPKKTSKSDNDKEKTKQKKTSDQSTSGMDIDEPQEAYCANSAIAVHPVTRMLRPELDIFMLRKYVLDFESYVSTVRKFIENASFISRNSKSAEGCLRYLGSLQADKFYDSVINVKKRHGWIRKREPSPDSGYSTSSSGAEKFATLTVKSEK